MNPLVATIGLALLGAVEVAAARFYGAITDSGDPTSTIVSGGVLAAAVGALVYVARLLASGALVTRNVKANEEALAKLVEESHRREADYVTILKRRTR